MSDSSLPRTSTASPHPSAAQAAGASAPSSVGASAPLRLAAHVLFILLVASLLGRLVFTLWEPPFAGGIRFGDVAALGDSYWPINLYLGGLSYAVSFSATAVFLVFLGRGRSSVLTLIGSMLIGLGGIVFSLVIVSETWPYALAANPAVTTAAQGEGVFEVVNANVGLLLPAIVGSQLVIALGAVLGLIGMLLGGTTPRWFALAGLVYIAFFQLLPIEQLGAPFVFAGYILQLLLLASIALFALRTLKPR